MDFASLSPVDLDVFKSGVARLYGFAECLFDEYARQLYEPKAPASGLNNAVSFRCRPTLARLAHWFSDRLCVPLRVFVAMLAFIARPPFAAVLALESMLWRLDSNEVSFRPLGTLNDSKRFANLAQSNRCSRR